MIILVGRIAATLDVAAAEPALLFLQQLCTRVADTRSDNAVASLFRDLAAHGMHIDVAVDAAGAL